MFVYFHVQITAAARDVLFVYILVRFYQQLVFYVLLHVYAHNSLINMEYVMITRT